MQVVLSETHEKRRSVVMATVRSFECGAAKNDAEHEDKCYWGRS